MRKVTFNDDVKVHPIKTTKTIPKPQAGYFDTIINGAYGDNTEEYYNDETYKEAEEKVNLLNTFIKFYQMYYGEQKQYHMFEGIKIDDACSTNKCTEVLQKHIDELYTNSTRDEMICLYDHDDADFFNNDIYSDIYTLTIGDDMSKICRSLLPLLQYINDNGISDWIIDVIKTNSTN